MKAPWSWKLLLGSENRPGTRNQFILFFRDIRFIYIVLLGLVVGGMLMFCFNCFTFLNTVNENTVLLNTAY